MAKNVARRSPNKIRNFFRETTGELRKVSWPTAKEARSLTVVVIIVLIFTSIFLSSVDYIGKWILNILV